MIGCQEGTPIKRGKKGEGGEGTEINNGYRQASYGGEKFPVQKPSPSGKETPPKGRGLKKGGGGG